MGVDPDGFDERMQTKPVHAHDGFWPVGLSPSREVDANRQDGVKMRDSGNVPGVAGE